ncbi:MAG: hypothetical protein OQK04_18250 [Kangiellaceae bacterium]|nr:hypothetical protein [Kangiellaceae bacterium]MCW9000658.1 hypothetical protein [Kangiellaceae bacterium]
MNKFIIIVVSLLVSGCVHALDVKLSKAVVENDVVTIRVKIENSKNKQFYVYGLNICSTEPLDKDLFSIRLDGSDRDLQFSGILDDAVVGFVPLNQSQVLECEVRLNFSYLFPETRGNRYQVQYIATNPKFKEQEEVLLKSNIVTFDY